MSSSNVAVWDAARMHTAVAQTKRMMGEQQYVRRVHACSALQ